MCFSVILPLLCLWVKADYQRKLRKPGKTEKKESSHVFAQRSSGRSCFAVAHKVITDLTHSLCCLEVAAVPASSSDPFRFPPSASPSPGPSAHAASEPHVPTSCIHHCITEAAALEVVRDKCRFQLIIMQSSSSSWVPADSCSSPLHIHLLFPTSEPLTLDPTPDMK